jgi:hypothetical protein
MSDHALNEPHPLAVAALRDIRARIKSGDFNPDGIADELGHWIDAVYPRTSPLILHIPDSEWEPLHGLDDPLSGLSGPTVIINNLPMHMEAWQVLDNDDRPPVATWEDEYTDLHAAVHGDGPFQALRIGDRDYVVVLSPHCD